MATLKFKDASPYESRNEQADASDFLYKQFERHLALGENRSSNKVRLALFGVGRAGTIHVSNLSHNPRVNIVYVVEDALQKWDPVREYWALENTTFLRSADADKVFTDPRVDGVVVASPTHTHEGIVTRALAHGKAVFCEKPIAGDDAGARRCCEQAERVGRPLFVAFNRRFDPAYSKVRERVRAGEVGHVQTIKVCSRDSPLPPIEYLKGSGGIFHDCAVHDIDMMCWVLGEYPVRVSTMASANIPEIAAIDDFDTVAMSFTFASGTVGMIDLSRFSSFGYDQRLEVFGPRGMICASNEYPMCGNQSHLGLEGGRTNPIYFSFASRYKQAYANEMEHFIDVVKGKSKPLSVGREMLAVTKIASAVEKSARTKQVVELHWTPEELNHLANMSQM